MTQVGAMRRRRESEGRRRFGLAIRASLAAGLLLAASACGSDDENDSTETSSTEANTGDSTQPTDTSSTEATTEATQPIDTTSPEGETPVEGGTLTLLNYRSIPSIDPALVSSPFTEIYSIFDGLTLIAPDGSIEYRLLESAESDDGITWTLTLRPDLLFSDDTPLNAEAIKFNWERLQDPAVGSPAAEIAGTIASMEVVDDLTLEVVLTDANGQFPARIATTNLTWIASPTAVEADPAAMSTKPIGAGAYMVESWLPEESTFVRNPNWTGTAYLDGFTIKVIPDGAQMVATMQSGGGDMMITGDAVVQGTTEDAGLATTTSTSNGGFVMFYNTTKAPFDDIRVRQAFSYATDPEALVEAVADNVVPAAHNMFADSSRFYDPALDQPSPSDEQAQELFDELAEENGGPLEVTMSYVGQVFGSHAEWFQTKMAGFDNVEVTLDPVGAEDFYDRFIGGDVQFGIHGLLFEAPDEIATFAQTGGPDNFAQYSNAEVDELLTQALGETDEDARVEVFHQVQEQLLEDLPYYWLTRTVIWRDFNPDVVHGLTEENLRGNATLMNELWVTR